jgi:hypothetical protein
LAVLSFWNIKKTETVFNFDYVWKFN